MNKKILSLAIAAAVAAPMAAQAEVKFSGSVARDLYNETGKNLVGGDLGTSKLTIDASEGDAFLRMAWDIRQSYGATSAADPKGEPLIQREQYAGIKVGGAKIMLGRQANAYAGAVTVDAMNATFLEARKANGATSKTASFVSGLLGVGVKAGEVDIMVQYGPAYKDMMSVTNPVIASVGFKAGPATIKVGYETLTSNKTNTGISAKFKAGPVNLGVVVENADSSVVGGGAAGSNTLAFVDAAMDMGGMVLGVGLGTNSTTSKTFSRVSVTKKMGKASVYAGVSNDGASKQRAGAGLRVDM
jgi:hypothetical protein